MTMVNHSDDPLVEAIQGLKPLLERPDQVLKAHWPNEIGGYQVLDEIAWSGQAVTLLAYDRRLKRRVVLKLYLTCDAAAATEGVLQEGERLAKVDSPFLARCLAADTHQGTPFLVLEYIEGTPLCDYSADGKEKLTTVVSGIADGLSKLHEHGLAHGDIKPSNIIVEPSGRPRIIDLGAASRAAVGFSSSTGTAFFTAPERAAGKSAIDPRRADVFSFGAVVYWMLSGRAPFQADSADEALNLASENRFEPLLSVAPDAPDSLRRICETCMAADPSDRFSSGGELLTEVNAVCRTTGHSKPSTRTRVVGAAVVLLLGLVGLLAEVLPPSAPVELASGRDATDSVEAPPAPHPYSTSEEIERETNSRFVTLANGIRQDSPRARLSVVSGTKTTDFGQLTRDDNGRLRLIANSESNNSVTLRLSATEETWVGLISFEPAADGKGTVPCRVTDECIHVRPGMDWSTTIEDLTASESGSEYLVVVSASRHWNLQTFADWLKNRIIDGQRGGIGKKTAYSLEVFEYVTEIAPPEPFAQAEHNATLTAVKSLQEPESNTSEQEIARLMALVGPDQQDEERIDNLQLLVDLLRQGGRLSDAIRYQGRLRELLTEQFKPKHWKVMEAEALLDTLETTQKLDEQDQNAVAQADADLEAAESSYQNRRLPAVIDLAGKAQDTYRRILGDTTRRTLRAQHLHTIAVGMKGKPFEARARLLEIEAAQRELLGDLSPGRCPNPVRHWRSPRRRRRL